MNIMKLAEFLIGFAFCFAYFNISMIFDSYKKKYLYIGAISSLFSTMPLLFSSNYDSIFGVVFAGLIFPCAYTDFKEKTIINFNCICLYFFSIGYILQKLISGEFFILINLIITVSICLLLVKCKGLGLGDMALIVPLSLVFELKVFAIIFVASFITIFVFFKRRTKEKNDTNFRYVPLAPGIYIGTILTSMFLGIK